MYIYLCLHLLLCILFKMNGHKTHHTNGDKIGRDQKKREVYKWICVLCAVCNAFKINRFSNIISFFLFLLHYPFVARLLPFLRYKIGFGVHTLYMSCHIGHPHSHVLKTKLCSFWNIDNKQPTNQPCALCTRCAQCIRNSLWFCSVCYSMCVYVMFLDTMSTVICHNPCMFKCTM